MDAKYYLFMWQAYSDASLDEAYYKSYDTLEEAKAVFEDLAYEKYESAQILSVYNGWLNFESLGFRAGWGGNVSIMWKDKVTPFK